MTVPIPQQRLTDANGRQMEVLTTDGGTAYVEYLPYRDAFSNGGQMEAVRVLACAWDDRHDLREDLLGWAEWRPGTVVGGVTSNLHRSLPDRFPHPRLDYLWCAEIEDGEGVGVGPADADNLATALTAPVDYGTASMQDPDTNGPQFNLYVCKAHYRWFPFKLYGDEDAPGPDQDEPYLGELTRFVEKRTALASEAIPLGGVRLYFAGTSTGSGNEPVSEAGVLATGAMSLLYRWHMVPGYQAALYQMAPYLGRLNGDIFDGVWPIGTCLFSSVEVERIYPDSSGTTCADLVLHFSYRNNGGMTNGTQRGWNWYLRPKTATWTAVVQSDTATGLTEPAAAGASVYNYVTFNDHLFQLPAAAVPNVPGPPG